MDIDAISITDLEYLDKNISLFGFLNSFYLSVSLALGESYVVDLLTKHSREKEKNIW